MDTQVSAASLATQVSVGIVVQVVHQVTLASRRSAVTQVSAPRPASRESAAIQALVVIQVSVVTVVQVAHLASLA